METDDLEQKKLVYLYLMNYAKTQPELVILAVNTFATNSPKRVVVWPWLFGTQSTMIFFTLLFVSFQLLLYGDKITQTSENES
jgi:hypothetical protein